jgi:hypothetical protein
MDPDSHPTTAIQQALYSVIKALARLALRYGLSAGAMSELVRRAYVDAAEEHLTSEGVKPLCSRVCALTGLYRKEVVRVKALPPLEGEALNDRYNRSSRVIAGWLRDPEFLTSRGRPAVLSMKSSTREGSNSFQALVRRYSGDMTPQSMLEELTRLQVIEITPRNRIRLNERAYVPAVSDLYTLHILGTDTADLIETIHHNIGRPRDQRLFQRKVSYLHIPERHVDDFHRLATTESQALLERLDRWLAQRDTEPRSAGRKGARVGLGIYQLHESHPGIIPDDSPGAQEEQGIDDEHT